MVLVGKGLRAPQLGVGEQAGSLAAAWRDPATQPGERGGCGFPVTLQRTAVTSRGLLGAVRAGVEAQEPCKPASVRILLAPSQTLETLHQRPPQRLTMRWRVASPLGAAVCPAWLRARYSWEHPPAVGNRGLPKLGETPDDPGLHRSTCSCADRHLPVQGSAVSTDTGGYDPCSPPAHSGMGRGEYIGNQLFSLLDKHRGEKNPTACTGLFCRDVKPMLKSSISQESIFMICVWN